MLTRLQTVVDSSDKDVEQDLINFFRQNLISRVLSSPAGLGKIIKVEGTTFADLVVTISYPTGIRRFALASLFNGTNSMARICDYETGAAYKKALSVIRQRVTAVAEEELLRQRFIIELSESFKSFVNKAFTVREDEEFYKALGWLTKLVSSVHVLIPACLEETFVERFGKNVTYRITDNETSRWVFKINLKKHSAVPEVLAEYFNVSNRDIIDAGFVLELVTNYGFKFAKQQDADAILERIPEAYQEAFISGLTE